MGALIALIITGLFIYFVMEVIKKLWSSIKSGINSNNKQYNMEIYSDTENSSNGQDKSQEYGETNTSNHQIESQKYSKINSSNDQDASQEYSKTKLMLSKAYRSLKHKGIQISWDERRSDGFTVCLPGAENLPCIGQVSVLDNRKYSNSPSAFYGIGIRFIIILDVKHYEYCKQFAEEANEKYEEEGLSFKAQGIKLLDNSDKFHYWAFCCIDDAMHFANKMEQGGGELDDAIMHIIRGLFADTLELIDLYCTRE